MYQVTLGCLNLYMQFIMLVRLELDNEDNFWLVYAVFFIQDGRLAQNVVLKEFLVQVRQKKQMVSCFIGCIIICLI